MAKRYSTVEVNSADQQLAQAVSQDGAYDILRKRLEEQAEQLKQKSASLNQQRINTFGQTQLEVIGRTRARTENNCVARDIVRIGKKLLFGYNVYIGLKQETSIEDVFALYQLKEENNEFQLEEVPIKGSFLDSTKFQEDFNELYTYYKQATLIQLRVSESSLLAAFQIGKKITDIRVFRWQITKDHIQYVDNRGERDFTLPPSHDFEWTKTGREDHVLGDHPHINILNKLFVETINGDLTVKIEDNTDTGQGIYSEPVEDKHQSLDDAEVCFAELGQLILLKIKPYREQQWRYLVYNALLDTVVRVDQIGLSCLQLPEDHGIIYPGGYYLPGGEHKTFSSINTDNLEYKRTIKAPNGEDVLYVFYEAEEGRFVLCSYNLIQKELANPIECHGYGLYPEGKMVIFTTASTEPTRIHPMQVWQTPYSSDEHAAAQETAGGFLATIGNAELVRAVSDIFSISKAVLHLSPSTNVYEGLIAQCKVLFDNYYWLDEAAVDHLAKDVHTIVETAEMVLDEFEKVQHIQKTAKKVLQEAETKQTELIRNLTPERWNSPDLFVNALDSLKKHKGHLLTIQDTRYINQARLQVLNELLDSKLAEISQATVKFISSDQALIPYHEKITELDTKAGQAENVKTLQDTLDTIEETASGLDLLTNMLSTLDVEDAPQRTEVLETISEIYAKLNQTKARANNRLKELSSKESVAEFGAQFRLFSLSITNALSLTDTPERCDEELSKLAIQLEEIETQFAEHDQFLADILQKREELYDTFEARKQTLLEERQRRAQSLYDSAKRVLTGIERRSQTFTESDQINTFFASDTMILKVHNLVKRLVELKESVKADELSASLKSIKDQALKTLRDKQDIYEESGQVIKLGKHKFSVNTQTLDTTILPRQDGLYLHLTGTNFYQPLVSEELNQLKTYWQQSLVSENDRVYRAEYLAYQFLQAAELQQEDMSHEKLQKLLLNESDLLKAVRDFASPRYQEGYEKGVHDHDAVKIIQKYTSLKNTQQRLSYSARARAAAALFWVYGLDKEQKVSLKSQGYTAKLLIENLNSNQAYLQAKNAIVEQLQQFNENQLLAFSDSEIDNAANYLIESLGDSDLKFTVSQQGVELAQQCMQFLEKINHRRQLLDTLTQLKSQLKEQWLLVTAWLEAYSQQQATDYADIILADATSYILLEHDISFMTVAFQAEQQISDLLGDHPLINSSTLSFNLAEFNDRLTHFNLADVPAFKRFGELRHQLMEEQRESLRLDEFKPKPLASFVRNKLINDVYFPIIGDNLAKQMGTIGDNRRTDLMGLLLLISPPGYGKTTLMEYVANRLGLIFMKINCPALGHNVLSLDPQEAPNATAAQELQKLNLALEMGNNVMLYLDDIQHTHPEFLQKFISLCDGTRRIEGVWQGKTKTYDMRGKKFCVIMAGNPYTESGEVFKIPDMLANRADIYNLGDVLSGSDQQFKLSYIENALTSNPVLAPLANRDMADIYKIITMTQNKEQSSSELSYQYSAAELDEIIAVLQRLFKIQDVVLKVNQEYIRSAATADKYRTEPPFKLQGSYRNMNKMAEKVVAIMNDEELQSLIGDHYLGEAQTLTNGAEENLLKLGALRNSLSDTEKSRWQQIQEEFQRIQSLGGDDADSITQMANQVVTINRNLQTINSTLASQQGTSTWLEQLTDQLQTVGQHLQQSSQQQDQSMAILNKQVNGLVTVLTQVGKQITKVDSGAKLENGIQTLRQAITEKQANIQIVNQPSENLEDIIRTLAMTIETSFMPVVTSMNHKIGLDQNILRKVNELTHRLQRYQTPKTGSKPVKP
ncbi:DNA repair ATPase [Endozoicomonas sp. SM1973]|uniref:DNA repair ATPase n=1 Tax=Spartinivicinus marinus TaxID=2994442 RepID=A0A853ICT7_9GAMM|nr:DNA repair ATPase [Spartinivicinus marinus]NYZ68368.1 DNA repair ATPase [Spartinivicinus marinus]